VIQFSQTFNLSALDSKGTTEPLPTPCYFVPVKKSSSSSGQGAVGAAIGAQLHQG
jgi:hypothetical protein